jgi:phospholipase/lecithinase/hemolysin
MKSKLCLFFLCCIYSNIYATATSQLILENECNVPADFKIQGNGAGEDLTVQIEPHNYYLEGDYINNNIISNLTSTINISFNADNDKGEVKYLLNNGWTSNYATFKKVKGNIFVDKNNLDSEYKKSWHSYSGSLQYIIPTFTISSCSIDNNVNLQTSDFNGIDRVLIFGDSLSDAGNLYSYLNGLIPRSTPYNKGMFSNGDIWAVRLKNMLIEQNIKMSNYAVGGATAVLEPSWTDMGLPYNLDSEILFYNTNKIKFDSNEKRLAIFFMGANDYLTAKKDMTIEDMNKDVTAVTEKIFSSVKKVGAAKSIIIGLPDLSLTLESKRLGNESILKYMIDEHNQLLKDFVQKNVEDMRFIDIDAVFKEVIFNTDEFNKEYHSKINKDFNDKSCWHGGYFIQQNDDNNFYYQKLLLQQENINSKQKKLNKTGGVSSTLLKALATSPTLQAVIRTADTGTICDDPEHYIFWDEVHPTPQVHRAIYQYLLKEMGVQGINTLIPNSYPQ